MRRVIACAAAGLAAAAGNVPFAWSQPDSQPNAVFLVAKATIRDPNFSQTVVLATQTPDAHTVGVILNRPSPLKLSQFFPEGVPTQNYKDAVYIGGPVMRQIIVALFRSESPPAAAAFHVLPGLYLTMHPRNVERLLASEAAPRYRLYAGFSGWSPGQLKDELERDGWYVVPADEETALRSDPSGLWKELHHRASRKQVQAAPELASAVP
jgi:putative transcriptional regulator